MLISDIVARTKWCPFVRIDNNNRLHNSLTDGFENSEKMYHCIGNDCMGWRQFHLTHYKGSEEELQGHGFCGYAGKIEVIGKGSSEPFAADEPEKFSEAQRFTFDRRVEYRAGG